MADLNPTQWKVIGSNTDETGAAQIQQPRPIGGGATADGQDETTILAENSTYGWTYANRAQGGLTVYGEQGAGGPFYTTTVNGVTPDPYEEIIQWIIYTGVNRSSLTFLVDHAECDTYIEIFDDSNVSLDSGFAAVSTRTLSAITLDASAGGVSVRAVVSVRSDTTNDGLLYGITVLEDAAGVTTSGSPDWKKLDSAATGANVPYDAFLLHRIDRNNEAAYQDRVSRSSCFWPTGDRPILASHQTIAYPMGLRRVLPGDKTWSCDLRAAVSDAAVNFGWAIYDLFGSRTITTLDADVQQAITAGATVGLTDIDVTAYQGRPVLLLLLVRSEDAGVESTIAYSAVDKIVGRGRIDSLDDGAGGGTGWTWTSGKRWKIEFLEPAAGSVTGDDPLPEPRTVAYYDSASDDVWVWPLYSQTDAAGPSWSTGNYRMRNTIIGQAEIQSIRVYTSAVQTRADLRDRLRPGMAPAAGTIKTLYARQRQHYLQRTRVHADLGGGYDPGNVTGSDTKLLWGTFEDFDSASWQDMGATIVRGYESSLAADGSTSQPRATMRIVGAVMVQAGGASGRVVEVDARAVLSSFSAGAWGGSSVTSQTATVQLPTVRAYDPATPNNTADNLALGINGSTGAYHYLRGALDPADLIGTDMIQPVELVVDDTETGASQRLVRLQLRGDTVDIDGQGFAAQGSNPGARMWLMAWGAWVDETID